MKVFLSWSGTVSLELSQVFRDWLPMVLQYVKKPYVSSEDIDKGARWLTDIVSELETSYYGILFITRENVEAPWLNFEAGALAKAVQKSRVTPFLFDLEATDFSGPLTQFQAVTPDKLDVFKLLISLNRAADKTEQLTETRLKRAFEKWWPELRDKLAEKKRNAKKRETDSKEKPQSQEMKMLKELLELTRGHQNVLQTPEVLFPQDYFEQLISVAIRSRVPNNHEIQKTLGTLERRIEFLQDEFGRIASKIRNVPKPKIRNIVKMINDLSDPLLLLTEELKGK